MKKRILDPGDIQRSLNAAAVLAKNGCSAAKSGGAMECNPADVPNCEACKEAEAILNGPLPEVAFPNRVQSFVITGIREDLSPEVCAILDETPPTFRR